MHIWEAVREGGWGAYLGLFLGFLAGVLGVVALGMLAVSRKAAFVAGMVGLALCVLAGTVGVLGMFSGRRMTEEALSGESVRRGMKERIRAEGYRESSMAPRVAGLTCVLPLLLAGVGAMIGARRRESDPPSGKGVMAGAAFGVAALATGGALAASFAPLPKERGLDVTSLLDARDHVDDDRAAGCDDLEHTLREYWWTPRDRREWPRKFSGDPRATVPDLDAVATGCAKDRFDAIEHGRAIVTGSGRTPSYGALATAKVPTIDELLESPLLLDDELHRKALDWEEHGNAPPGRSDFGGSDQGGLLGLLGGPEGADPAPLWGTKPIGHGYGAGLDAGTRTSNMGGGAVKSTGSLPADVIKRVVRAHLAEMRHCYETGLAKNPSLSGTVTTKFVIAKDGTVTSADDAGSTMTDASVTQCIQKRFLAMKFPEPSGGVVVVTYPMTFSPG